MADHIRPVQTTTYSPGHEPVEGREIASKLDEQLMRLALQEAEFALHDGNPPIGAVLWDGQSQKHWSAATSDKTSHNLLDHAEIKAYELAQAELGTDLARCALYSTLELCPMCTSVYAQGNIGRITVAASRGDIRDIFRRRELGMHEILFDSGISVTVARKLLITDSHKLIREYKALRGRRSLGKVAS